MKRSITNERLLRSLAENAFVVDMRVSNRNGTEAELNRYVFTCPGSEGTPKFRRRHLGAEHELNRSFSPRFSVTKQREYMK